MAGYSGGQQHRGKEGGDHQAAHDHQGRGNLGQVIINNPLLVARAAPDTGDPVALLDPLRAGDEAEPGQRGQLPVDVDKELQPPRRAAGPWINQAGSLLQTEARFFGQLGQHAAVLPHQLERDRLAATSTMAMAPAVLAFHYQVAPREPRLLNM